VCSTSNARAIDSLSREKILSLRHPITVRDDNKKHFLLRNYCALMRMQEIGAPIITSELMINVRADLCLEKRLNVNFS
jgi:hypothetical protein